MADFIKNAELEHKCGIFLSHGGSCSWFKHSNVGHLGSMVLYCMIHYCMYFGDPVWVQYYTGLGGGGLPNILGVLSNNFLY